MHQHHHHLLALFSKQGFIMTSSSYVMEIAQSWEEKEKKALFFFQSLGSWGSL